MNVGVVGVELAVPGVALPPASAAIPARDGVVGVRAAVCPRAISCSIDKLSGTKRTRAMLEAGEGAESIVTAWRRESRRFQLTTERYRLY